MRLIDADALKERIATEKFHNYGYALVMVCDQPTVLLKPIETDINADKKTETFTAQWSHEADCVGSQIIRYSRCTMCKGCVDGFVNYRYCPNCGAKIKK